MILKISFKNNKNYFNNSILFKELKNLIPTKMSKSFNIELIDISIQLFMESIIKHNLDINMLIIDQTKLLSEDNSDNVLKVFGKIAKKEKEKRTENDLIILNLQNMVLQELALYCFYKQKENIDLCTKIKDEFIDYLEGGGSNKKNTLSKR